VAPRRTRNQIVHGIEIPSLDFSAVSGKAESASCRRLLQPRSEQNRSGTPVSQ